MVKVTLNKSLIDPMKDETRTVADVPVGHLFVVLGCWPIFYKLEDGKCVVVGFCIRSNGTPESVCGQILKHIRRQPTKQTPYPTDSIIWMSDNPLAIQVLLEE